MLELLLVLAMLVMVTSMVAPTFLGPLDNQRLRRAADQVRISWVKTRTRAMEKGIAYVFRYTPGSNRFTIEPWFTDSDYLESNQLATLGTDANGKAVGAEKAHEEVLPEYVTFMANETALDARAELLAMTSGGSQSDSLTSPLIFFYPDGTTSTARLVLSNRRNRMVTLTMRGLTGVIHVTDLVPLQPVNQR